ncbi:nuclear transport factor 2 family protein [Rhizobium rhizogenes]|uniref:nuclear transport factor 2 family protein n=1 Tax=Rhizobium rhizogenes TaxID=359 RepID=UPI0015719065|nr:nuclear transport factor 2 family protein [Rhizobium rhizogenes]NTH22957.1 nuclear transport factor 2 family protein [Rhizobium rhizogenes]NTH35987.1 nuclear transport factor 2 family protein [Rhizobium rhizogenes]
MLQSTATIAEEQSVKDVISSYLKGLRSADKSLLKAIFADNANIMHLALADEKFAISSMPEFLELVDKLHADFGQVEEFHGEAVIAVSGPVASVHVPFTIKLGTSEYSGTDVFSLARISGGWKIVNKLYSM